MEMSKEKTQHVTFRIGKRHYTITQELPPEPPPPPSKIKSVLGVGITREEFQQLADPAIMLFTGPELRERMMKGKYATEVLSSGTFPLHKMEPEKTVITVNPRGGDHEVTVTITFDQHVTTTLPTDDELKEAITDTLGRTDFDYQIDLDLSAITPTAIKARYVVKPPLQVNERQICHAVTHHALVQAFTPLLVKNRAFSIPGVTVRFSGSARIGSQYLHGGVVDDKRVFLEMFHLSESTSIRTLRDRVFTTRKGDPRPLFRSGTQKKTRDRFFRSFLGYLARARIVERPNDPVTDLDPWVLTPYGKRVYEDLESTTFSKNIVYYNI